MKIATVLQAAATLVGAFRNGYLKEREKVQNLEIRQHDYFEFSREKAVTCHYFYVYAT